MLKPCDLADHQVIAAVREYNALQKRRYTITKLDTPIQSGWRRSYVLTERATVRQDRPILEEILAVIGSEVVHHSPEFRRRQGRRRKLIEIEQPLKTIYFYEWERKHYPDEWMRYFRLELVLEWKRYYRCWVFMQPALFELKVQPNWLWYLREVDPAIETRLSELEQWLVAREGWQSYWRRSALRKKEQSLQRISQHEIKQAYINYPEVDPTASTRCRRFSFRQIIFIFRVTPDGSQARSDHTTRIRNSSLGKSPIILAAPMPIRG